MITTPICCNCGVIPVAEPSFKRLEDSNRKAARIMYEVVHTLRDLRITCMHIPVDVRDREAVQLMEEWLSAYVKGGS
jgi:hypothetical protein